MAERPLFAFFGAGDATYFEWAAVHVLFARDLTPRERKAIAARVPSPLTDSVTWKGRHLVVASGQTVHADIADAWPEGGKGGAKRKPVQVDEDGESFFFAKDSQVDRFNEDIERWLNEAHARCPILAAYRPEDEESGGTKLSGWHRWSLKQFPGLWTPLKYFLTNEDALPTLEGIAVLAARGKIRIPKEFKAVQAAANLKSAPDGPGRCGYEPLDRLVEKLGLRGEFGPAFEAEARMTPRPQYPPQDLLDQVLDAGLARTRKKLLAELGPLCRKAPMLGNAVAYRAFQFFKARIGDALDVFEVLVQLPALELTTYNNAIAALTVKGRPVATPAREQRFIKGALPYAKDNPSILANVACVSVLRGRREEALDLLEKSVQLGHDRRLIRKDVIFHPLHKEPRWRSMVKEPVRTP